MKKAILICATAFILVLTGCKKDEEQTRPEIDASFGMEKGIAAGMADFSEDEPEISIKNIVTYVGEDIDYSTGIEVSNTEKYEDFQMWVDATAVDIHTVGTYEAVYKFVYGDKTKEVKVVVSVIEKAAGADEPSGDSIGNGNTNNTGSSAGNSAGNGGASENAGNSVNSGNGNAGNSANNGDGNGNSGDGANGGDGSGNAGNSVNSGDGSGNAGNGVNSGDGSGNAGNSANNSGGSNGGNGASSNGGANSTAKPTQGSTAQTTTARRQIVTSSGQNDTKSYSLGYMNIELLSGSVVKIKCTSSKYIVSTRTDVSTTTKDGVNYNVYKLVVTYNTGAEQVLETYEEKIN